MKTIALLSNTAWSIYNFRMGVMKALKSAGYNVVAIAPKDKYTELIAKEGFECKDVYIDNRGTNPINDFKTLIKLCQIFKDKRVDLVFCYTIKLCIYGSIAAKIFNIKSISVITGLGYVFVKGGLLQRLVKWMYKISLSFNEQLWFLNNEDRELFEQLSIIYNSKIDSNYANKNNKIHLDRIKILKGEGINTEQFTPITVIDADEKTSFLLIARMLWDKGVGEYVEAARILKSKYPKVKFYILGFLDVDNPTAISKEQMDAWVAEGVVEYLGVSDKVHEIIGGVDCVVLPSSYREGVPRVLMEASSMEKPIITTDTVGCRDVVDDGLNGFLCRIKDPIDLAEKMERIILMTQEERIKMGKAGREKMIREFDERIIINKYIRIIKEIIG